MKYQREFSTLPKRRLAHKLNGAATKSLPSTSLPSTAGLTSTPNGSQNGSPVRVLVAGDHATLRSSLKTMLELDPQISVVGEAADDCEMIKMAHRLKPEVVLVDLDMRCCDKYEAVAEIRQQNLASAIVALTIHDDEAERATAHAAGVSFFLEKGVPYRQLISTVRSAAHPQKAGADEWSRAREGATSEEGRNPQSPVRNPQSAIS